MAALLYFRVSPDLSIQTNMEELIIMKCPLYDSERRMLVCNLKIIKMKSDLINILQRNSYEECIHF